MIKFVENKSVEMESVALLMKDSIDLNHHTNSGPLSRRLEHDLTVLNKLSQDYQTLVGASATALIYALASSLNNVFERDQRWVSSDFGFLTNFVGPLVDQTHLPCDNQGMLDLEHLRCLNLESYDVICLTNVFGLFSNFDD